MTFWNKQDPAQNPGDSEAYPSGGPPPLPSEADGPILGSPRRDEPAHSTNGAAGGLGGANDLRLGAGVELDGKLTFKGTVRIDAKFKGSIVTDDVLIVGEHARIDAKISCGTVIVQGTVNGDIKATSAVELRRPARVSGDVETPSLVVEKGVVLNGTLKMPG